MLNTYEKSEPQPKRRPVTLSVRSDLLVEAKALNVNASRAAERGLIEALRKANESQWLSANDCSMSDYNKLIDKSGTFFTPDWIDANGAV